MTVCALHAVQTQVPAERVTSLAFSTDGANLAAGCWGGAIFLYHKAGSRWAGVADAEHSSSAAGASEAAVLALPTQDLSVGPQCAAAAAASPEAKAPAAPGKQVLHTGPPPGLATKEGGGGPAAQAAACGPVPQQASPASGLAAVDHGIRGSGGWIVGKG